MNISYKNNYKHIDIKMYIYIINAYLFTKVYQREIGSYKYVHTTHYSLREI